MTDAEQDALIAELALTTDELLDLVRFARNSLGLPSWCLFDRLLAHGLLAQSDAIRPTAKLLELVPRMQSLLKVSLVLEPVDESQRQVRQRKLYTDMLSLLRRGGR
jgi:hypothetical protein